VSVVEKITSWIISLEGGISQTFLIFILRNGTSEARGVVGLGGSLASVSVVSNVFWGQPFSECKKPFPGLLLPFSNVSSRFGVPPVCTVRLSLHFRVARASALVSAVPFSSTQANEFSPPLRKLQPSELLHVHTKFSYTWVVKHRPMVIGGGHAPLALAAAKPHRDQGGSIHQPLPPSAQILDCPNPCANEGLSQLELVTNPSPNRRLI